VNEELDRGFWQGFSDLRNLAKRPMILTANGMYIYYDWVSNSIIIIQWAKSPKKKQSEGVRFFLIRHSKYSVILSNYTPTDCFFGDFAHWVYSSLTTHEEIEWHREFNL